MSRAGLQGAPIAANMWRGTLKAWSVWVWVGGSPRQDRHGASQRGCTISSGLVSAASKGEQNWRAEVSKGQATLGSYWSSGFKMDIPSLHVEEILGIGKRQEW